MNKKSNPLDSEKANSAINLDAKLHQGYDPSTEFKHTGNLFSSVSMTDAQITGAERDAAHIAAPESFWTRVVESVNNFFSPDWHEIETARENNVAASINTDIHPHYESTSQNSIQRQSSENKESLQNELLGVSEKNQSGSVVDSVTTSIYPNHGYLQPGGGGGGGNNDQQDYGRIGSDGSSTTGNNQQPSQLIAPVISAHFAQGWEGQAFAAFITLNADSSADTTWVTISGLPQNAVASAGLRNGDGSWTFTPAELVGLTIISPDHDIGSFPLHIFAASSRNGQIASTSTDVSINILAVAEPPDLLVHAITGNEDASIALNITASLVNPDPSETLTITIAGVPAGAILSAGIHNNDGTWTLSASDLNGLSLTPPLHYSGNINLDVTAIAAENGTSASTTASFAIDVHGVATTPLITTHSATGLEDTAITLNISAALQDNDGSETLAIVVANVPAGAILSAGTNHGSGIWILNPADLNGLTLTPPADFNGGLALNITAVSMENGTAATASATLNISVLGTADPATLTVQPATGNEDTAIALNISANTTDAGEALSLIIGNLPPGSHLSAGIDNGNGTWTLTSSQLAGLTFTPPVHSSGAYNLSVTAITSENGTTASTSANLALSVAGIASAPTLAVSAAAGLEDTSVPLVITAGLSDNDGSETLSITIGNMPPGSLLSAGTDNGNGTWTLTQGQLNGLSFTPPAHANGNYDLSITVTSSENGTSASINTDLHISIAGVASAPTLSVLPAVGAEDSAIHLDINAVLVDNDGSENLAITISNLPPGSILSAGTHNPDGTWTLTSAQLTGLNLIPPPDFSGSISLDVTATSSENGTTASTAATLAVTVTGVADAPLLSVQPASGNEDTQIALNINAAISGTGGTETLSVSIYGVPAGAVLSAGTHNPDGSWTLTSSELTNLVLTPAPNLSGSLNLIVTAISSEDGTTASTSLPLSVTILGVADVPTLNVQAATGNEDTSISLNISAALDNTAGSETLSIIIAGLPAGASLSAGIHNPDGSWTLTQAQLSGLTLTPGANWSGTSNLSVTAISSENGTSASTVAALPLTVHGVADIPTLSVQAATGLEDSAIALHINAALTDNDGSETLTVTIGGVPTGAVLSAGTHNPDGTWTLTGAQLTNLTLTPAANFTGALALTITATASEDGTSASSMVATLPVNVHGVADTPLLSIQAAAGNEDTAIALNINASLADTTGGETLSVSIIGVPNGASLSAGTHNPDGSWTLTSAQLASLTLTPPTHWSGEIDLTVTATSSQDGTSASAVALMPVIVAGVATTPLLTVGNVFGAENVALILPITALLADTDGSETLSVTINGLPAGAILSAGTHNPDGSWTLTPGQLNNLTLIPGLNWNGTTALTITATSSENGTTASTSASLPVSVSAVAHTPSLSVHGSTGAEDTPIALHITSALSGINPLETMSVTIGNVPPNATLSAGINNGDGTWTLTDSQLTGLTLTPSHDFSGSINLSVTSTSTILGSSSSVSTTLPIIVTGVADAPTLSVQAASGTEDNSVALNIASALTDIDGSETLVITITGLPAGATLSAGTHNPDGSYTLTSAQLGGLTLTPPANWSGTANLSVTATSSEAGTTASTSATLPLTIAGVADVPTLSVQGASGNEDTAIALHINAALTDNDGSETLAILIAGLPAGAILSAGTDNGNGTWSLTPAQLVNLSVTPANNWSGTANLSITAISNENGTTATTTASLPLTVNGVADTPTLSAQAASGNEDTAIALTINAALTDMDGSETLSITIGNLPAGATLSAGTNNGNGTWTLTPAQLSGLSLTPAANWSGTGNLLITATSSENGTTASTSTTLPLNVAGVADTPTLSVQSASGNEDAPIVLHISVALTDTDGSETLSITIGTLPTGASLSAGINNGNGTWTLTPAQLTGLTLNPAANWSGSGSLTVTATSSENGTTATTTTSLPLTVAGIADTPTLSVQSATGNEDTAIALHINAALTDLTGGETLSITIAGLPAGATLSAGTHNPDGSYTLTSAQLTGLTLNPAANWSGTANLTVTATSSESGTTASTSSTLALNVNGVADTPTLSVQSATGNEDTAIVLNINAALTDTDGSENLSITIAGIPANATLSAGTHNQDGTWTLTQSQLTSLTLTPSANYSGNLNLTVTATSSESGTTASTVTTLPLHVLGVADIPTLSIQSASGNEDSAIALNIRAALTDTDGSEQLSISVGGMPAGASLSAGINNGNGTWTLTQAQLTGLTLIPPADWSGTFTLSVSAASGEDGTWATATTPLHVNVVSVADKPALSVGAASGLEDTAIALTIQPALTDGSESLSVMISGVPTGAVLSAGSYSGNGHWSLSSAELSGLTITPPANYSGTIALTATAISTASNGASATMSLPINVTVTPVADAPTLTLGAVTGKEDNAITLGINAALRDTDGSENLTIQITGVPTGATLSAGTNAGGGVWNLSAAQLANLKITPPANSDVDFTLNVTATSHETNGATSSVSGTIPVTVIALADIPTVSASNVTGAANAQIPLTIAGTVTDSSENLTYVVHGIPDGFSLNQGTNNGDNSWTLTQGNLSGLKLISPPNFNGQLTLYAQSVSHDNDGSTALSTATPFTAQIGNYASGYLVNLGVNLHLGGIGVGVSVGAVPVDLFQTVGSLLSANTNIYTKEDTPTQITANNFNILALPVLNGLTTLVAHIEFWNVPTGVTFSAGANLGGGVWAFTTANMQGLTMYTPANSDADFSFTVVSSMLLGLLPVNLGTANIHVQGIADMPTLTASIGGTAEDTAIALNIAGASTDTDGSEAISFLVAGVPVGFTLNHGIDNGNGTWSLQSADLSGLTVTPAQDYSGAVTLTISSIATEKSTATDNEGDSTVNQTTVNLNVAAVADAPILIPVSASGTEDHAVSLNLGVALKDTDGSESISSVIISGLPSGATLTGATDNHNGTWSADVTNLNQVQFVPGNNWHGDVTLTVTATSREASNGSTASTTSSLSVHIDAVADTPIATATDSTGTMGNSIGLHLAAATTDSNEHLSALISGVPHDAMLSAGLNNGDGTWTVSANQLSNLSITPADHFIGDLNLSLTAFSREDNGSLASTSQNFSVHVAADPANPVNGSSSQSWLDATDTATGGTPADPVHTASQDAQTAIDAASLAAHTAGSDYQNAFQSHQTG